MKFSPSVNNGCPGSRGIIRDITAEEIEEIFGFAPNVDDDPMKAAHSWAADVSVDVSDVVWMMTRGRCSIRGSTHNFDTYTIHVWDYKNSHEFGQFSVCGDPTILENIFGDRYQNQMA